MPFIVRQERLGKSRRWQGRGRSGRWKGGRASEASEADGIPPSALYRSRIEATCRERKKRSNDFGRRGIKVKVDRYTRQRDRQREEERAGWKGERRKRGEERRGGGGREEEGETTEMHVTGCLYLFVVDPLEYPLEHLVILREETCT